MALLLVGGGLPSGRQPTAPGVSPPAVHGQQVASNADGGMAAVTGDAGLFETFTVWCIFCWQIEQAVTPAAAHDAMERHYSTVHPLKILRIVGTL